MKVYILIQLIMYLTFICQYSQSKLSCKNEMDEDVEWYVGLKYPKNSSNYIYISSDLREKNWKSGKFEIINEKNLIGVTLKQIYKSKQDDLFYIFYNDNPPIKKNLSKPGHLKGVLSMDKSSGFWLIHSIPKFPAVGEYKYGKSQLLYAQSFICVSIFIEDFYKVVKQLLIMYSSVYNYKVPKQFKNVKPVHDLVNNTRGIVMNESIVTLKSVTSIEMIHFAKSNKFDQDLYADLMAPELRDSLYTQTWQNGNGQKLSSECNKTYKVYNIISMIFPYHVPFKSTVDHSKWAVTVTRDKPFVCIGDINRIESQFKRGGGALCIKNIDIWNGFRYAVNNYEGCRNTRSLSYLIDELNNSKRL